MGVFVLFFQLCYNESIFLSVLFSRNETHGMHGGQLRETPNIFQKIIPQNKVLGASYFKILFPQKHITHSRSPINSPQYFKTGYIIIIWSISGLSTSPSRRILPLVISSAALVPLVTPAYGGFCRRSCLRKAVPTISNFNWRLVKRNRNELTKLSHASGIGFVIVRWWRIAFGARGGSWNAGPCIFTVRKGCCWSGNFSFFSQKHVFEGFDGSFRVALTVLPYGLSAICIISWLAGWLSSVVNFFKCLMWSC